MFYSMGPGVMSVSVTSARSGSELSDSDMESSTLSLNSLSQPAQVPDLPPLSVRHPTCLSVCLSGPLSYGASLHKTICGS